MFESADNDSSNLTPICLHFDGTMLDMSELVKTQCNEFVDILNKFVNSVNSLHKTPSAVYAGTILSKAVILKTKLCHLQAVVEHEKLVKSVAIVCDRRNAIKPTENTLKAGSYHDDRSSVDNCRLDGGDLGLGCGHDDSETGNKCKQDDPKSELDCNRDGFVDNRCGQDDLKPETNCNQYDSKSLVGCKHDDSKPELKEGDLKTVLIKDRLTEILQNGCTTFNELLENNEKFIHLLRLKDWTKT